MVECPPDIFLAKSVSALDEILLGLPRNDDYLCKQVTLDSLEPLISQYLEWLLINDPSVIDRKGILEYGLRELLNKYAQEDITDFEKSCALIDLSLALSSLDYIEQTLPHALLEVVLDLHPVDWCQAFFSYIESRESQFAKNLNGNRAPGTTIIRFSNGLLRRLSKTLHLNFAGRILIFLARAFPITEISGLNPKGDFDVENVTQWDAETDDSGKPTFYSTFWSLQPIFSNPLQLFEGPGNRIEEFNIPLQECFTHLLPHITSKSVPLSLQQNDDNDTHESSKLQYMPKWLTDRGLFQLELQDVSFRRVFYAQVHILFDFLFSLTSQHKQLWSKLPQPLNKSLTYPYTLSERDHRFYSDVLRRFFLDSKFPESDARFFRMLREILANDANWVAWKLANQKPFSRPSLTQQDIQDTEAKFEANKRNKHIMRYPMGTPAITQLWKVETGLDTLRSRKRKYATPEDMYEKIKRDKHTATDFFSTDEEKEVASQVLPADYWRTLRVARGTSYWCKFSHVNPVHGVLGLFEQPPPPPPAPIKSEVEDELGSKAGTPAVEGDQQATSQPTAPQETRASVEEAQQPSGSLSKVSEKSPEQAADKPYEEIPTQASSTETKLDEEKMDLDESVKESTDENAPLSESINKEEPEAEPEPKQEEQEKAKHPKDGKNDDDEDYEPHFLQETIETTETQQVQQNNTQQTQQEQPNTAQQPPVDNEQETVNKPLTHSVGEANTQVQDLEHPLEQQALDPQHSPFLHRRSGPTARGYTPYQGRPHYARSRPNSFGYRQPMNGRFNGNNSNGTTWNQHNNNFQEENGANFTPHNRGGFNRGYNSGFRGRGNYNNYRFNNGRW